MGFRDALILRDCVISEYGCRMCNKPVHEPGYCRFCKHWERS